MKTMAAAALIFVLLVVLVIPAVLVRGCDYSAPPRRAAPARGGLMIEVYSVVEDKLIRLPMEEYVKGVVAAEMPASFEMEALKAQAVVARTYAVKRMRMFGGKACDKHPKGDICSDPSHSQAWISSEELKKRLGLFGFYRAWRRVEQAVRETEGIIIRYQGEPVDPVYHSTSGGATENSEDVWENYVPYLRGVPSPYETDSPYLKQRLELSLQEFANKLGQPELAVAASTGGTLEMKPLKASATGRVKQMKIGNKVYSGVELREMLGLRSSLFTWELKRDRVIFDVSGYGHGVGLSQYGANGLAKRGNDYRQIITYYYTGVELGPIFVE